MSLSGTPQPVHSDTTDRSLIARTDGSEFLNAGYHSPTVKSLATIMLSICLFAILVYVLAESRVAFTVPILLVPILSLILVLVKFGYTSFGTRILLWGVLLTCLVGSYWVSGVSTPILTILPVLLMSSFWLLGQREAIFMFVVLAISVSWQFYLQTHGWQPPIFARPPIYYYLNIVGILVAAMLLGNAVAKHLISQYTKLKVINQELESHQKLLLQEITLRKNWETQIQQSEELFRKLFELNPDPTFITSFEGKFLDVNESACSLLGYTKEEFLNIGPSDIDSPEFAAKVPERINNLRTQGYVVFESGHIHKNGTFIPVEISNRVITIQGQEVILGVARDLSSRKREEELRHQAKLENALVNSAEKLQQSIGHEIHDNLGQILSGISLLCKALQQQLATENIKYSQLADSIVQYSNSAINECKNLSSGLAPIHLESRDFISSLAALATRTERLFNVTVNIEIDPGLEISDSSTALHLYRIIQESTSNAIRHGNAENITVSLSNKTGCLTLSIKDDGNNPSSPGQSTQSQTGMGLKIMQYRAKQIGAEMKFSHLPEGGTEVLISAT